MSFLDKLSSIAKDAGEKAGEAVEITKLKHKVSKEKDAIEDALKKIGEFYLDKCNSGEELPEPIAAICGEIKTHNEAIEDLMAQIAAIKE